MSNTTFKRMSENDHLVEEQNEVEGEGQEESQEAQVVEVSREVVLQQRMRMMKKLKATKLVDSSSCALKRRQVKQQKMCHHEFIPLGLQLRPDLEAFFSFRLLFSLLCGLFRLLWGFLRPALRFLVGLLSTFSADQQTQRGHGLNGGLLRKQL